MCSLDGGEDGGENSWSVLDTSTTKPAPGDDRLPDKIVALTIRDLFHKIMKLQPAKRMHAC